MEMENNNKGAPHSPMIVAMKGHPGTGKTTVARSIAAALRWPLLDKDDIRDATTTLPLSSATLNDLSYDAVFRLAATQLRHLRLSVVVDTTLSRRAHLDSLVSLAGGPGRVVIVECRPSDEEEWRRRLERRGEEEGCGGHKPATWRDLERLLEGYGGCTEYDVGEVQRIIVDTTSISGSGNGVVSHVLEFIQSHLASLH